MISAVKNHSVPVLFGLASIAFVGVIVASMAFPHLGSHMPWLMQKPNFVGTYIGFGGAAVLATMGVAAGIVICADPKKEDEEKLLKGVAKMGGMLVVTIVALVAIANAPSLERAIQATIITGTVAIAGALALKIFLQKEKGE